MATKRTNHMKATVWEAITVNPQHHLRELLAEAGRAGFLAGVEARRIALLNDEQAKIKADQYAESIRNAKDGE